MPNARWDAESYKTGYDGVELPERFPTAAALEAYRRLLLEQTERETALVARHLGHRKLRVMDLCSGNGRFLVKLALEGMLDFGLGVEISRSRVAFAQDWLRDLGLQAVQAVCADALEFHDFDPASFDLVSCIGDTFSYFAPVRENAPVQALATMRRALVPTGCVLLHVYQVSEKRKQILALNNGKLRVWRPLPPEDRFAYYLSDIEYLAEEQILTDHKIFIGRDGAIDTGRVEVLRHYSGPELVEMLRRSGFEQAQVYGDFDNGPYRGGESEMLVILAGMSGWHDEGRVGHAAADARRYRGDGPGAWVS